MVKHEGTSNRRSWQRLARKSAVVLAIVAMLLPVGCQRIDAEQAQVVRAYVDALIPALHAETLAPLREVATPAEVKRMQLEVMGVLYGQKQRMTAQLTRFEITSSKTTGKDKAQVWTEEAWIISYADRKTGKLLKKQPFEQKVRYTLQRNGGRWYVAGVKAE
jgi:hypothetical protein